MKIQLQNPDQTDQDTIEVKRLASAVVYDGKVFLRMPNSRTYLQEGDVMFLDESGQEIK